MRILHLATDLGPTATGRRVSLLVPALTQRGLEQTVITLDPRAVFSLSHIPLPVRPFFDIAGWRKLRRLIADYQPSIIHAWGHRAVTLLNVIAPTCSIFKTFDGEESFFSRRRGQRLTIPVIAPTPVGSDRAAIRRELGLVDSDRMILVCDRFETAEAVKIVVDAMELLKFNSQSWKLLVIGDGPAQESVVLYAVKLLADDYRIRFLGLVGSVSPILAAADLVWHPRKQGGAHFIAEARTRSLPVFAHGNPALAGIALIPVSDAVGFAAKTNLYFEQTTSDDAPQEFPIDPVIDNLLAAYQLNTEH